MPRPVANQLIEISEDRAIQLLLDMINNDGNLRSELDRIVTYHLGYGSIEAHLDEGSEKYVAWYAAWTLETQRLLFMAGEQMYFPAFHQQVYDTIDR